MKKVLLFLIIGILICSVINTCKLDPPIYPGEKGYVQQYPPQSGPIGSSGNTNPTVNVSALDAKWTVQTTVSTQTFAGQSSTQTTANFFKGVTIDTADKIGGFIPELSSIPDYIYDYVLSGSGSSLAITFSQDPFPRTANGPIQITKLTSTTMVWVAVDQPQAIGTNTYQLQYQVTFTK